MKTVFIFHDSFSNPTNDWIPWVRVHLEAQGFFVVSPGFPTPAGESLESWMTIFSPYLSKIDAQSIFIGHGTGATFALRLLEKLSTPIAGTILVAPYVRNLQHQGFQKVSESFVATSFNWEKILSNSGVGAILHGDNDPFVPAQEGQFVAEAMRISPSIISDGGHLNKASGFDKFVQLITTVRDIQKIIGERAHEKSPEGIAERMAREEAEAKKRSEIEASDRLRGFKTMERDMGRTITTHSGAVVTEVMAMAHDQEAAQKEQDPMTPKNIAFIAFGTLLILGGLGTAGYFFMQRNPTPVPITTTPVQKTNSIIRSDRSVTLDLDGIAWFDVSKKLFAAHREKPIRGTVVEYIPAIATDRGRFFEILDIIRAKPAPILLRGYLNQDFMWGAYGANDGSSIPFLVFRIGSYDGTFAGMREWEGVMPQTIAPFLNLPKDFVDIDTRWEWNDEMVANKTIRTLRFKTPTPKTPTPITTTAQAVLEQAPTVEETISPFETKPTPEPQTYSYENGDLVLLYMFINEQTMVVTTRDDILSDLVRRYADSQVLE